MPGKPWPERYARKYAGTMERPHERENIKGAGKRGLLVRWEGKGVNNTVRILHINRLKS